MKLLEINTFQQTFLNAYYRKRPQLAKKSFTVQKTAFELDCTVGADYWSNALAPLGFEVMGIAYNAEFMQRAWAVENSLPHPADIDLKEIALAQIKNFKPDVLWFNDCDEKFLQIIRSEAPSIRLVLGWVGSAIPKSNIWRQMDLVLSCAMESIEYLKKGGINAEQLHLGFDPRVNMRIQDCQKQYDFTFIGQLIRFNQFHMQREYLLEQLAKHVEIDIFSSSADFNWKDEAKALTITGLYGSVKALKAIGISDSTLKRIPLVRRAVDLNSMPLRPVNPILRPFLRPAVFGLDMFQVLRDSKISLNIHADSSPRYASNLRLFEATGVGSCLLTDWRSNLSELFVPDSEVVTYKNQDECVEKTRWLLDHPTEREEIAKAGQKRVLTDHTYAKRANKLDSIIRNAIK